MRQTIEQSIVINSSAADVWSQIIDLYITTFRHPAFFRLLDIPKPLKAELSHAGLGGERTAYFAGGKMFKQEIVLWQPPDAIESVGSFSRFNFTFRASPDFRVGYLLNLHSGPFQMKAGAYRIEPVEGRVRLYLSSEYELIGFFGACLLAPVRCILFLFQLYLLRGIERNAESEFADA